MISFSIECRSQTRANHAAHFGWFHHDPSCCYSRMADSSRPREPEVEAEPAEPAEPAPEAGALGDEWASKKILRNRVMEKGYKHMTRWLKKAATGIPSVKAMSLNHVALECIASWYCPTQPYPKMINVDIMRDEADFVKPSAITMVICTQPFTTKPSYIKV